MSQKLNTGSKSSKFNAQKKGGKQNQKKLLFKKAAFLSNAFYIFNFFSISSINPRKRLSVSIRLLTVLQAWSTVA